MSKTWNIINISAVALWVALLFLLLYREHVGTPLEKQVAVKEGLYKATYWYDVYAGPKKIGFANTTIERVGEEIIIRHEREMKVTRDSRETVLSDRLRCLTDPSFSMKSFEYSSHFGDEKGIKVAGEVDSEEILFFLESPEKRKTFKTPTNGKEFYFPITFISALVQKDPAPGSTFSVPVLDFSSLTIKDVKVSLEEIRPVKVGIGVRSLYRFKAAGSTWWSSEKGMIIKEANPTGITLYSEPETIAKDPSDRTLFDYSSLPVFKAEGITRNPEELKALRIRIKGLSLDPKLYESSLVTVRGDNLTIRREDPNRMKEVSYKLPYKDEALNRYLKADEWVLSEDKKVKDNAYNMAVIEKNDAFRMARYLNSNLYLTVAAMPMFILSNAKDIFESHLGDYLERAVMFASFARAAGLPTRLVGGLVYRGGYFYFHTWPEVWFDRWVPMEPTLAQFPADVTHVPLKEGTLKDITSIVDDLRSVSIEILEAS